LATLVLHLPRLVLELVLELASQLLCLRTLVQALARLLLVPESVPVLARLLSLLVSAHNTPPHTEWNISNCLDGRTARTCLHDPYLPHTQTLLQTIACT